MLPAARLIVRLAWRNLRARPGQALLLLCTLCLAMTTISLAMAVTETGERPWERLWQATNGAHVYAGVQYRQDLVPGPNRPIVVPEQDLARARAELAALATAPGVVAASGPWYEWEATGEVGGIRQSVLVKTKDAAPAVGAPLVTSGSWLGDDGVVLEDGFASTLRVKPGDTITIAGQQVPVRGTAMTPDFARFPYNQPGCIWVTPALAEQLRASATPQYEFWMLELRLADPDDAASFVAAHTSPGGDQAVFVQLLTWQQGKESTRTQLEPIGIALGVIATLLAGMTIAMVAVLVAGRMAAQVRQVGTLKAVGVTPGQVTWVLLVEYLALGLTAAAIGIFAGTALSPLFGSTARDLYGAVQAPAVTWSRSGLIVAIAIAMVLLGTVRPAWYGAWRSTLRSLAADVRPPRRVNRFAQWVGTLGLPRPVALGLRSAMRRPVRTLANAAGLALAVAMAIMSLALHDGLQRLRANEARPLADGPGDAVLRAGDEALQNQLLTVVLAAAALLLVLAGINTVVVAVFAARDSARNHAIQRALGATPRQTVTAFVIAQLWTCVLACAVGIPLGIAVFNAAAGQDLAPVRLPVYDYLVVVVAALVLYALAVSAPARLLATRPVTPLLAYE